MVFCFTFVFLTRSWSNLKMYQIRQYWKLSHNTLRGSQRVIFFRFLRLATSLTCPETFNSCCLAFGHLVPHLLLWRHSSLSLITPSSVCQRWTVCLVSRWLDSIDKCLNRNFWWNLANTVITPRCLCLNSAPWGYLIYFQLVLVYEWNNKYQVHKFICK